MFCEKIFMESLLSGRCYSIPEVIYCLYKTVCMQTYIHDRYAIPQITDTLTIINASVFHPNNLLIFTQNII